MEVGARHQRPAIPREVEELAVLYGTEARRLYSQHAWEQLEPSLAEGWHRLCHRHDCDWTKVRHRVHAAWIGARMPDRHCS